MISNHPVHHGKDQLFMDGDDPGNGILITILTTFNKILELVRQITIQLAYSCRSVHE